MNIDLETLKKIHKVYDLMTVKNNDKAYDLLGQILQEKQFILPDVSFELPDDKKLNNFEVDIETPLKEFYFYHRPPHLRHEQKEFRRSLKKALKYLQGN